MSVTRHFLGWDRPLCETVPAWLLAGDRAETLDLRDTVAVTPTRQASWRLREALPLAAHARGAALLGPEIVTAPALLHPPPDARRASDLQTLLAWCATLKAVPAGALDAFLGRQHPNTTAWALQIARRLTVLRAELADGAFAIRDVAARGAALEEADRWAAMAELEQRYLAQLESWHLRDPVADQLAYARDGAVLPGVRRVILAAMPDPPQLLVALLEKWAQAGVAVDVLVAAPEAESAAFDAWGRPVPDAWAQREIPLAETDLLLAANPEEQAGRIAGMVQTGLNDDAEAAATTCRPPGVDPVFGGRRAVGAAHRDGLRPSLAVGVPDRETVAPLQRELAALGLPAFDPQNRLFADTPLFRLVQALLAWRERPGYVETAALLRHPDVLASLPAPRLVLCQLDEVQYRHLPVTFVDLQQAARDRVELAGALARLDAWRAKLAAVSLAAGLRVTLQDVYAARQLHPDRPRDAAFRQAAAALDEALREFAAAEDAGQAGADAAAALLARLQNATIKPERADERLDLEGWLELAWNPAPILFVAGMNEGFVPDSRVGDVFLPDSLRRELDLRDDCRRVARDACVLTALLAQRRANGRTLLLVGKTSLAGDPLRPSRLLFRCADDALVARAQKLFAQPPPPRNAAAFAVSFLLDPGRATADAGMETAGTEPGPPGVGPTFGGRRVLGTATQVTVADRMSATKFRDYLACPLRFYLRHVLKMEAVDDLAREPDGGTFGTLIHDVLQSMAREGAWSCGDEEELADWLEARLRARAAALYGARPWLGVTLAVESAVRRLRVFAARQVAWHQQGWEIVAFECDDLAFTFAGTIVGGRIDRVDRNRNDGRLCVLDYKTTDTAKSPDKTHLATAGVDEPLPEAVVPAAIAQTKRDQRWTDLQLPLYREMVRAKHGPGAVIGHVLLPATLGDTAFACWDGYSDALHERALACAAAVIARIRAGVFWPPSGRTVPFDDFTDLLFDDPARFMRPPSPAVLSPDASSPPPAGVPRRSREFAGER